MSIRRDSLSFERGFTRIPNVWLRDPHLSRRARGLLAELMTHAEGYVVTFASLLDGGPEGKDALRSAIDELRECGYLRIERERAGGRFGETSYVLQDPADNPPQAGFPDAAQPATGNPDAVPYTEKTISEKNINADASKAEAENPLVLFPGWESAGGEHNVSLVEAEEPWRQIVTALIAARAVATNTKPSSRKPTPRAQADARVLARDVAPGRVAEVLAWAFGPEAGDPWWLSHVVNASDLVRHWDRMHARWDAAQRVAAASARPVPPAGDHERMLAALGWTAYDWETSDERERAAARQRALGNGWVPATPAGARASA